MPTTRFPFPDSQTLAASLAPVLSGNGASAGELTILDREPNVYSSTFPGEIVTCRLADGSERRVLCKYADGQSYQTYGHRGGIGYEAAVYRHVLQPLQVSTPAFYGVQTEAATGKVWLMILEYLDGSVRLDLATEPTALRQAARWIGRFHAAAQERLARDPLPFLRGYDAAYYRGWARRTSRFAGHLHKRFPWLASLCERAEEFVPRWLLAAPPTVVHGECYPHNVLLRDGVIAPIDWESAAIATGEIDLASLTDRWPDDIAQDCQLEYRRARWPEGSPADFELTLDTARLYLHCRWLGEHPDLTIHPKQVWRLEPLRLVGERLGLI